MALDATTIARLQARLGMPKRTSVDGHVVEEDSISDVIKALEYCDQKEAASNPNANSFQISVLRTQGSAGCSPCGGKEVNFRYHGVF